MPFLESDGERAESARVMGLWACGWRFSLASYGQLEAWEDTRNTSPLSNGLGGGRFRICESLRRRPEEEMF